MNTRTIAIIALTSTLASSARADENSVIDARRHAFEQSLGALEPLYTKLRANLAEQDRLWPNRLEDELDELPPPPRVAELRREYAALDRRRRDLLRTIADNADQRRIAELLDGAEEIELLRDLVPVAAAHGDGSDELLSTLAALAARFEKCPAFIVDALATFESRPAAEMLLSMGLREKDPGIAATAAKHGYADIFERLARLADDPADAASPIASEVLRRITPPERPSAELVGRVIAWVDVARQRDVRMSLIAYAGRTRDPSALVLLRRTAERSDDSGIRAAAIAAMGHFGDKAAPFVLSALDTFDESEDDPSLLRSCVLSLATSRHRPAVPELVELLADARYRADAAFALRRIAGEDFGDRIDAWQRWWQSQPEWLEDRDKSSTRF